MFKLRTLGNVQAGGSVVPLVSPFLDWRDHLGAFLVRWGFRRDNYKVAPGLYGVGTPGKDSRVFVTANYKLTFDTLRKELKGMDVWILVLDTRGINVWCAAGKGTFGTKELVNRVLTVKLADVVEHRQLVLPQLGATGVSAHSVKSFTRFQVAYGPVRAADLPEFIANGMMKTPGMREVRFGWADRLVLVPMEIMGSLPYLAAGLLVSFAYHWAMDPQLSWHALSGFLPIAGAVACGAVIVPALLPYVPFRAFALKGMVTGIVWSLLVSFLNGLPPVMWAANALVFSAVSAFLAMNFTGASTYTSLAGAQKEVRIGAPLMLSAFAAGMTLYVLNGFKIV